MTHLSRILGTSAFLASCYHGAPLSALRAQPQFYGADLPFALPAPPVSAPPPPPDASAVPAGMESRLFRRSAHEVARELQNLFSSAFSARPLHLLENPTQPLLTVRNPIALERLRSRLNELANIARRDAWAAREYDRPEIVRFYYLSNEADSHERDFIYTAWLHPEVLGIFFQSNIALALNNPSTSRILFHIRNSWARSFPAESIAAAQGSAARAALALPSSSRDPYALFLNTLTDDQLFDVLLMINRRLSHVERRWNRSDRAETRPFLQALSRMIEAENRTNPYHAASLSVHYAVLVLASRGMTAAAYNEEMCRRSPSEFMDYCPIELKRNSALESSDNFDNASTGFFLREEVQRYLSGHTIETHSERPTMESIRYGSVLLRSVVSDYFAVPLPPSEVYRLVDEAQTRGVRLGAASRGRAFTFPEIAQRLSGDGPFAIALEDIPQTWRLMAQGFPLPPGFAEPNLWEFLRANVRSVQFVPQARELERGTVNQLTRSAVLELTRDSSRFAEIHYFFTLIHEAHHLHFTRTMVERNPSLWNQRLLDERNAFLFQSFYYPHVIRGAWNGSGGTITNDLIDLMNELVVHYAETRINVLASNRVLGFNDPDDTFREGPALPLSLAERNLYPTDAVSRFFPEFDDLAREAVRQSGEIERSIPELQRFNNARLNALRAAETRRTP